jgi:DNA-binding CsgD family transcriptional regulator
VPYLERLRQSPLEPDQQSNLDMAFLNLKDLLTTFGATLSAKFSDLTPREIQVAMYIRDGKSSRRIAELLEISIPSVNFHRRNIRRKLRLSNKKINLRSYLISLK